MQLANNARTFLTAGIAPGDTSLSLSDATSFPTVTATALTGTVTSTVGNAFALTGSGTLFTSELAVGNVVTWTGIEWRRVVQIISNTSLILDREASVSGVSLTKRDTYPITVVGYGSVIERMLVLSTSGNTFLVARAQDDSTAQTFSNGASVEFRVTAELLRQVVAEAVVDTIENLGETHGAGMIGLDATGVSATTVETGIEEIAADLAAHEGDATAAHAASAISFTPVGTIAGTDVQTAVAEVATDAKTYTDDHITDPTAAHAASAIAFTPGSGLTSTDVQAAIEEAATLVSGVSGTVGQVADVVDTTNEGPYDDGVPAQVSRAVSAYVAGADYWTCTGTGTAFTLAAPGNDNDLRKPTAYFDGMQVRFFASAENTGAASVDVGGLGPIQVKDDARGSYARWRAEELVTLTYLSGDFFKETPEDGAVLYSDTQSTSGTWNKPAGYSLDDTVLFRGIGGGGGGGVALNGAGSAWASGGEGGSTAWYACRYGDCPASVPYTVGAKGVGHNLGANGATAGTAGGDTELDFGTFTLVAKGGAGGTASTSGATTTTAAGGAVYVGRTFVNDEWTGGNGGDGDSPPTAGDSAIHGAGGGGGAYTNAGTSSTDADGGSSLYAGAGGRSDAQHTPVASAADPGVAPGGGGGAATGRVAVNGATSGDGADGEFSVRIIRGWHPYGFNRGY